MNSPEYRSMVSSTVIMTDTFAMDIMTVGGAFWERGVIPPGVNDILNSRIREPKEKSRELVSALTSKVKTSRRCFKDIVYVILDVDRGDWMKPLLDSMKKKFQDCGGKDFPRRRRKARTNGQSDQLPQGHVTMEQQQEQNHDPPPTDSLANVEQSTSYFGIIQKYGKLIAIVIVLLGIYLIWRTIRTDVNTPTTNQGGDCHPISKQERKLVYKTLAQVGNWEHVCLFLEVNGQKRAELQNENIPVSSKISRCIDAYFNTKLLPCFENIVSVLCNDLHRNVLAKDLAEKTGVDYQTVCDL